MIEKYKFIILPPDGYQTTMFDRFVEARHYIQTVFDVAIKIGVPKENILVKYRTAHQKNNFPTDQKSIVGYGSLLDYCSTNTIVIGGPGSGMVECLTNEIRYFLYWNFRLYQHNRFLSATSLSKLIETFYIATSVKELHDNILHNKIFKPNFSNKNLLHNDAQTLAQIVVQILNYSALE